MSARADLALAWRIVGHDYRARGMAYNLVRAARVSGIPVSLACALVEQESGFTNVFGHDPSIYAGAGRVTRDKYLAYKRARMASGNRRMQGVGPCQLTWYATQDAADRAGGCWRPYYNMLTGFGTLADSIRRHGTAPGIASYNGSGEAAIRYASQVLERQRKWRNRLT